MKRVLVAGATGYLGGFVTREFKERLSDSDATVTNPPPIEEGAHSQC